METSQNIAALINKIFPNLHVQFWIGLTGSILLADEIFQNDK
jgi:hypothetical protein